MKKPLPSASSFVIAACALAGVFKAHGQLSFATPAAFEEVLVAGYYLQTFNAGFDHGDFGEASVNLSGGTPAFSYTISVPEVISDPDDDTLWIAGSGDLSLSTTLHQQPVTVTFTGGNVTAVGGNFFLTDGKEEPIAAAFSVEVKLSDGTTESFPMVSSSDAPFLGYIRTDDKLIASLTIGAGGLFSFTTLDNLYVGTAVPEPSQWGLCFGLASLAFAGIRRWQTSR